jgi:5-methyltetrahydrofolate corrinoid/iron sulfur protein methyltransferase
MFVISEMINGMYQKVARAIQAKDAQVIQALAKEQVDAGADALDVNCGPASREPVKDMCWLVETIQSVVSVPLSLDSTKLEVIEEGLKTAKNRTIINSSSADIERLQKYIAIAKKYNSSLIALTMDKKGVPQDKDRRLELAAQILACAQENDFPTDEIYLDPIVLPVNVAQKQLSDTLEAIRDFKMLASPAPKTVVGLSNVSQGSTQRSLINRTFLIMAQAHGLDAAILDPLDKDLMDVLITSELILGRNIYCDSFIDAYKKSKSR